MSSNNHLLHVVNDLSKPYDKYGGCGNGPYLKYSNNVLKEYLPVYHELMNMVIKTIEVKHPDGGREICPLHTTEAEKFFDNIWKRERYRILDYINKYTEYKNWKHYTRIIRTVNETNKPNVVIAVKYTSFYNNPESSENTTLHSIIDYDLFTYLLIDNKFIPMEFDMLGNQKIDRIRDSTIPVETIDNDIDPEKISLRWSARIILDICTLSSAQFIQNFLNCAYGKIKINAIDNSNFTLSADIFGKMIEMISFEITNVSTYYKDFLMAGFSFFNGHFTTDEISYFETIISGCDTKLLYENLLLLNIIQSLEKK